jgi:transposase-like protein
VKKRFSEEQIVGFLKEVERGVSVKDLCRRRGFSEASYYLWRSKYRWCVLELRTRCGRWTSCLIASPQGGRSSAW